MSDELKPRRRGRPRTLSIDDVFDAACRVMDKSGPDTIAIRSVAQELGVHPTSLYVYVESREQLVRMVAERLLNEAISAMGPPDATREGVIRVFVAHRNVLVRHPRLIRAVYAVEMSDVTEALLPAINAVINYLRNSGLSDGDALRGYAALMRFTAGSAWFEHNVSVEELDGHARRLKRRLKAPHMRGLDGAQLLVGARDALSEVNFESDLGALLDRLTGG